MKTVESLIYSTSKSWRRGPHEKKIQHTSCKRDGLGLPQFGVPCFFFWVGQSMKSPDMFQVMSSGGCLVAKEFSRRNH